MITKYDNEELYDNEDRNLGKLINLIVWPRCGGDNIKINKMKQHES